MSFNRKIAQQILFQIKSRNLTSKIPNDPNWKELSKCQIPKCDVPRLDDDQEIKTESHPSVPLIEENWNECKKPIEPKKFSCEDYPVEKTVEKRLRKSVSDKTSACPSKTQAQPNLVAAKDCLKIKLENCGEVNISTKCMSYRPVVDCKKVLAPKPSFSECQKDEIVKNQKTECKEKDMK